MITSLRFGVFAQLVISFLLAVVMTLSATFIGIYSIQNINEGVEEVVFSRLPALGYAYQLGQQSEAIIASAPLMVRSKSQTERETIAFRISDQLRSLNETLEIIRGYNIKQDLLDVVDVTRMQLVENFARLDEVISASLITGEEKRKHHNALKSIVTKDFKESDLSLENIIQIQVAIDRLLLISVENDQFVFEENKQSFIKLINKIKDLDFTDKETISSYVTNIEKLAIGENGLIALHEKSINLDKKIDGLLSVNSRLSSRFIYSANTLIWEMTQEIEEESSNFQKFVDDRTTWLSMIVIVCVCSIALIATMRVNTILRRLNQLKKSMKQQAYGAQGDIDTSGNDEISDMANALKDLVNQLGIREKDLQNNENRFRDLVDATSDWFWEMDENFRFSRVSNRFYEISGLSADTIVGMTRMEFMEKYGVFSNPMREILNHKEILQKHRPFRDLTYTIKGKTKVARKVKISGKPMFSEQGVFIGYRGTGTDITRESQAESLLKAANDIMPGGIALWDDQNRLVMWNYRFEEYYQPIREHIVEGASFESLIDRMSVFCIQSDPAGFRKERCAFREKPDGFLVEEHFGGRFLQLSEASTNEGGIVTLATDITERMHSEQRLDQARLEAETANKAKSRFLAAASHDLRQPLHAMGMHLSRLQERRIRSKSEEAIEDLPIIVNISDSLEALGSLMNSLLDISKLEAGVTKAEKCDVELRPLVERLVQRFNILAEEKDLKIRIFCPDIAIYTDPVLIERVLSNLLSNAVRYTDEGGVLIGIRQRQNDVWIEIYDTGIGISKSDSKDIFIEFQQLKNPARDRRKGLGLGLAIVDRVMALLGHQLQLNSVVDQGTRFRVIVPKGTMHEKKLLDEELNNDEIIKDTVCIVVIDDDPDILNATTDLIEGWGYDVMGGLSTHEIIEQIIHNQKTPDLILADYRLAHNQNGAQAIRTLHQYCNKTIPGVIITGETAPDRIKQAKASGFHLLHKPLRPGKIRQLIRNLQNGRLK